MPESLAHESGQAQSRGRVFPAIAVAVIAALLVVDQARFTFAYMRHFANEDHTLLWYAARDLGHGHLYQSSFYGESYFTIFDAVPIEFFRRLGVTLPTAGVLSGVLLAVSGWPLLALAAWRRGHRVLSAAALAFPLVVTFEFLVASEKPSGAGVGMLFSMGAVALLVVAPDRFRNVVGFTLLGSLGVVFDFGNVYLVAPAAVYALIVNRRALRTLEASVVACLPAVGWVLLQRTFFASHPDYDFHKGAGYRPQLSNLESSLPHPGRYFSWQAPELFRWVGIPIAAALLLLCALAYTRRARAIFPALTVVVLVVATLAMPKAFDGGSSAFLGYGRYFVALPAAAWFLAYVLVETGPFTWASARHTNQLIAGVLAVAAIAALGHAIRFNTRIDAITRIAEKPIAGAPIEPVGPVEESCPQLLDAARRHGTDLILFHDRTTAYACGAEDYGKYTTLYPQYDRRTWLMHQEEHRDRTLFLVAEAPSQFCARALRTNAVKSCTFDPITPSIAVVDTEPRSAIETWRKLGETVRPFNVNAH
jgi:hypothetical protein